MRVNPCFRLVEFLAGQGLSLKHPFRNGKVPVRDKPHASMIVVASAAMTDIRRIHRHLVKLR